MTKQIIINSANLNTTPLNSYGADGDFSLFTQRVNHQIPDRFFLQAPITKNSGLRSDDPDSNNAQRDENPEPNRSPRYATQLTARSVEKAEVDYLMTLYCVAGGRQAEFGLPPSILQYVDAPVNRWGFTDTMSFELRGANGKTQEAGTKFRVETVPVSDYTEEELTEPDLICNVDAGLLQRSSRGFNYRLTNGNPIGSEAVLPKLSDYTELVAYDQPLLNVPANGPFAGTLKVTPSQITLSDNGNQERLNLGTPTVSFDNTGPRICAGVDDVMVFQSPSQIYLARTAKQVPAAPAAPSGCASNISGVWYLSSGTGLYRYRSYAPNAQWTLVQPGNFTTISNWGGAIYAAEATATSFSNLWRLTENQDWEIVATIDLATTETIVALFPMQQKLWALTRTVSTIRLRDLTNPLPGDIILGPTDVVLTSSSFPNWPVYLSKFADQGFVINNILITTDPENLGDFTMLRLASNTQVVGNQLYGNPNFDETLWDTEYPAYPTAVLDNVWTAIATPWVIELKEDRPDFQQLRELTPGVGVPAQIQIDWKGERYEMVTEPPTPNFGVKGIVERNDTLYAIVRTYAPTQFNEGFNDYLSTNSMAYSSPADQFVELVNTGATIPPETPDQVRYTATPPFPISNAITISPTKYPVTINGDTFYIVSGLEGLRHRNSGEFMDQWYLGYRDLDGNVRQDELAGGTQRTRFQQQSWTNWDVPIQVRYDDTIEVARPGADPSTIETTFGANADSFDFNLPAVNLDQNVGESIINGGTPDQLRAAQVSTRQDIWVHSLVTKPPGTFDLFNRPVLRFVVIQTFSLREAAPQVFCGDTDRHVLLPLDPDQELLSLEVDDASQVWKAIINGPLGSFERFFRTTDFGVGTESAAVHNEFGVQTFINSTLFNTTFFSTTCVVNGLGYFTSDLVPIAIIDEFGNDLYRV